MAPTPAAPYAYGGSKKKPVWFKSAGAITTRQYNEFADPKRYRVNVAKTEEAITQPLYSYVAYPAAGASTLAFFSTAVGGAITQEDTNMQLGAQLPQPQRFLIQGIGIDFLSGLDVVTGPIADSSVGQLNDFWAVMKRGVFTLNIGSKDYLTTAPLMTLPPRSHIDGEAAVATSLTAGAATQTKMQFAYSAGNVFGPNPLLIEAGQNFRASIAFPSGAVALPSANATSRIGVILYGTLYRPAQ